MKKLIILIILPLCIINSSNAELPAPPFEFTVDEKISDWEDTDTFKNVKKSSKIINDEFWNQPLTKLDYVLIQLKQLADERLDSITDKSMSEYFEKNEYKKEYQKTFGKYKTLNLDNDVYFDKEKGKIIIGFEIDGLGKAKQPMSEICQNILELYLISFVMPKKERGMWFYHNTLLNELYRGDQYENYSDNLKNIANNIIYILKLTSEIEFDHELDVDFFTMACILPVESGKYEFRKSSFSLRQ